MAATTYTSTVFTNNAPTQRHTGNTTVAGQYSSGATAHCITDVIFLAKIPHGAQIVEFAVDHSTSETSLGIQYGFASGISTGGPQLSILAAELQKATIIRKNLQFASGTDALRVSCSVSDPARYGIFSAAIVTGSCTTSLIINFSITYRCDENQGL